MQGGSRGDIIDPFGRRISYVRLSVTDRCNFRCVYCMPDDIEFMPRQSMLSFEEIGRLCVVLAQMGIEKIRLTGGEPTVRQGIVELVEQADRARAHGLRDLAMTTNGWNLRKMAGPLRDAGLDRVNVSLDTLDRCRFKELTRRDQLDEVLAGIEAVVAMGWLPLKLNVVVCQGLNDLEVVHYVEHFSHLPVTIRFIEYMPFGQSRFGLVPWDVTRRRLEERFELVPVAGPPGAGPATNFKVVGSAVEVGTIGAMSRQFCDSCNRVRITTDGRLKTCLAYEPEMLSLRDLLRSGCSDDELEIAIRLAIRRKPERHLSTEDGSNPFEGSMVSIGG